MGVMIAQRSVKNIAYVISRNSAVIIGTVILITLIYESLKIVHH